MPALGPLMYSFLLSTTFYSNSLTFFSQFRKSVEESLIEFASVDKVNYWYDPWFVGLQVILNLKPEVQEEALLACENWPEGIKNVSFQASPN